MNAHSLRIKHCSVQHHQQPAYPVVPRAERKPQFQPPVSASLLLQLLLLAVCAHLCLHACVWACVCRFKSHQMSYREQTSSHSQIPGNLTLSNPKHGLTLPSYLLFFCHLTSQGCCKNIHSPPTHLSIRACNVANMQPTRQPGFQTSSLILNL